MKGQYSVSIFLVILMAGLSASSSIQNLPDIDNEKFSHTQNVVSNWEWSRVISGSEDIVSDDIGSKPPRTLSLTGERFYDDLMTSNGGMNLCVQLKINCGSQAANDYGTL